MTMPKPSHGWSASQYARFSDERTRPARDLLAAVPASRAGFAVDLGCGPGNSTKLLRDRFPEADILGIDTSTDMLAAARRDVPDCAFDLADIATWRSDRPCDLLFANASLQWLPDHSTLFPKLLEHLSRGGSLAVQMPDNLDEPPHLSMRALAAEPRWRDRLAAAAATRESLLDPKRLHALLTPLGARVDAWRTVYQHVMDGPEGVVEWFGGSGLRPYLAPLDADEREDFLSGFREDMAAAYPANEANVSLLPFPRYFFVATVD